MVPRSNTAQIPCRQHGELFFSPCWERCSARRSSRYMISRPPAHLRHPAPIPYRHLQREKKDLGR